MQSFVFPPFYEQSNNRNAFRTRSIQSCYCLDRLFFNTPNKAYTSDFITIIEITWFVCNCNISFDASSNLYNLNHNNELSGLSSVNPSVFFAKVPHSPAVVWLLHIILVHFDSDLTWFDTAFVHSVWCLFRRICLRLVWQAATTAKNQPNCGGGRLAQEDVTLWMGCYTRLYIICFVYEQLGLPMPFDELSSDMIQR